MHFDPNAKTCSCPIGSFYNTTTKICTPLQAPLPPSSSTIPTWMIVVGVIAGLGIMAAIFGKPAQTA